MNNQIEVYLQQADNVIYGKVIKMPEDLRGTGRIFYKDGFSIASDDYTEIIGTTLYLWGDHKEKDSFLFCQNYCSIEQAKDAFNGFLNVIEAYNRQDREMLTSEEKEYISAIIKPFKDRVLYISKCSKNDVEIADLCIAVKTTSILSQKYANTIEYVILPIFKIGTMYNGLVTDKEYSLTDLDLD